MKTERNRRVKGSVLFTVVSVMSLLIIFLMATLVLATSANKRAHKSYSTSQTQYTARTAVDSVFQAIGASQDFADSIGALSSTNKGPLNVTVELDNNASSMGRVDGVTVEWVDSQYFYDETDNKWEQKDLLRITADVTLGGQTTTGSSYILKDPPLASTTLGGGAGFVTAGGAQTSNHTSAFGGTYFNIRELVNVNDPTTAYATLTYDLVNKNYLTGEQFQLGNGQVTEANLVVNGSIYFNTAQTFFFPYQGTGIAIWGDFNGQNAGKLKFDSINVKNGDTLNFNEIPYLYVDGIISSSNSIKLGSDTFPMNIFAGSMDITGNGYTSYADIYLMDNADSKFAANSTILNAWTASVVNKAKDSNPASYTAGNIYSMGNVELGNADVNGDVRVKGNVTISGNTTIDGDLVVGGSLTINNGVNLTVAGDMYASFASGPNVTVGASSLNAGYTATTYNAVRVKNVVSTDNIWNTIPYAMVRHDAVANWAAYNGSIVTEKAWVQDAGGNNVEQDFTFYNLNGLTLDPSMIVKEGWSIGDVTADITYDVYTRTSDGQVVEAGEAVTASNMSYNGKVIAPVITFTTANGAIYPEHAEKEVVIGLKTLKDPADSSKTLPLADTQVVQTIKDIVNSSINPYKTARYEVPSGYTNKKTYNVTDASLGTTVGTETAPITVAANEYIEFTGSGSISKPIYFEPAVGAEMWVVITDNINLVQTGSDKGSFVMVDTGATSGSKLNILIKDDKKLSMDKGTILTTQFKDIFDNNTPITVTNYSITLQNAPAGAVEVGSPQIFIYSEKDLNNNGTYAQLNMQNEAVISGHIKAPYLDISIPNISSNYVTNEIYYNDKLVGSFEGDNEVNGTKLLPIFGSLNVHKGSFGNNWALIYIDPNKGGGAPVVTPNHSNWYQTIYYEEY